MTEIPTPLWIIIGILFSMLLAHAIMDYFAHRDIAVMATQIEYMKGFIKSAQGTRERMDTRLEESIKGIERTQANDALSRILSNRSHGDERP